MQVIHISDSQKESGYEIVNLYQFSKTNGFYIIEKGGQEFISEGYIIEDTPLNRYVLDSIPKHKQLEFIKSFKKDPYVKQYYEEDYVQESVDVIKRETYTTEKKHQLLKDVDFPKGFGFWKTLRVILWDFNPNKKKINAFYFALDMGKSIYFAYKAALNV